MRRVRQQSTAAIAQGQLGVHRVLAELIARGHVPFIPVIDAGVDIMLLGGVRLQVKSTRRQSQHWRVAGAWSFTLSKAQRIVKQRYVKNPKRCFSGEVDFVILHAIDANRFWVVPAAVLDNRQTLLFKDGARQWKECDVAEARRLRAEGRSYKAIADTLGVEHHTVMRRIKGTFAEPKRKYTNVGQYENRWDLITGALTTLQEANDVVSGQSVAGVT